MIEWDARSSKISNEKGETVFALEDVEVPKQWSQLATDIVVSKYFRKGGVPGTGHETSVKQVVTRIARTIRRAGEEYGGYFATAEEADAFEAELTYMLITQRGAFNSPVWFNVGHWHEYGIKGTAGNWYWNFDTKKVEMLEYAYMRPQSSACFIQSVDDSIDSIFELIKSEARLFKYGSGTGTNFSKVRGKSERLSGGGKSSGLLSFLKVLDAGAGSIKSGGTTRRAAKMVCLDMDHPEIEDFINWKVQEEKKVAALVAAGYSSDFNGEAYQTVTAQNSNNSVRVTDAFMKAVEEDGEWHTYRRTDGEIAGTYRARDLWKQICQSAWMCADPGVQYDTTINDWHTCANTERIYASNPCSEYMFLDDTACNLASLNLVTFLDEDGKFDIEAYRHAITIFFLAQDILVDLASYPTKPIAENSHTYRTLGLGYANLGTLLMRRGIAYDSPEAMAITGALTAILTGHAYRVSATMAHNKGAFADYDRNKQSMLRVMRKHRDASYEISRQLCPPALLEAAQEDWEEAVRMGEQFGYRNAQATVIAPTGTIGLLMDCDTTSIEPDFALVKFKKLAGGGYFKIVNQSVPAALENLGYTSDQIKDIITYATGTGSLKGSPFINRESLLARGISKDDLKRVESALPSAFELAHAFNATTISEESLSAAGLSTTSFSDFSFDYLKALGFTAKEIEEASKVICGMMSIEGAPHLSEDHLPIFDCANKCGKYGTRFIEPMGHVRIMAAAQPFISGAISKTVNLPHEATEEEISEIYFEGWRLGLKAIAMYRDGSKLSQPLNSSTKKDEEDETTTDVASVPERILETASAAANTSPRRRLPDERQAVTHKFSVGGQEGYITVGLYENGMPGEIFIKMAKQGSTLSGLIDAFATSVSIALQYQVPLEVLVNKFSHIRFEPAGLTNNPKVRIAKSVVDYIFRWMEYRFLEQENPVTTGPVGTPVDADDGVLPVAEALEQAAEVTTRNAAIAQTIAMPKATSKLMDTTGDSPTCGECGGMMTRNGSCYLCRDCGATSGCS
jgi:ribonucleoside-diphosphate reductase alpha chain